MPSPSERLQRVRAFYAPLADSPDPARRVGWESDAAHRLRLATLLDALGDVTTLPSLLDAGCGEGALVGPLEDAGFTGRYQGEDLLPEMVARASAHFPDRDFRVHDLTRPGPPAAAVVCSGALNTEQGTGDHQAAAHAAVEALWARAEQVLVLDFAVSDRHAGGSALRPLELLPLLSRCRELCRAVVLREDIIAGEAVLVLRRDRRSVLARLLPGDGDAVSRARLLLEAREAAAARRELEGLAGSDAAVWRAVSDLAAGRVRVGERALRELGESVSMARLHLGHLLLATRREVEGLSLLSALACSDDPLSDAAALAAARHHARAGRADERERFAALIHDPWLRREAKTTP